MHPLSLFRYCPCCGSARFVEHDFKAKRCLDCGFTYYFNASTATAAFITNDQGQLLVARRAHDPAKGTLDLPGGFVDLHETAEEAMQREVFEETGLTMPETRYLFSLPNTYHYSGMDIQTVDLFFTCRVDEAVQPQAADDVSELFWLNRDEIAPELFGLSSIRRAIERWLSR